MSEPTVTRDDLRVVVSDPIGGTTYHSLTDAEFDAIARDAGYMRVDEFYGEFAPLAREWAEANGYVKHLDVAKQMWTNDPTETYVRTMAAKHPDWRPIQVLRAVLDALDGGQK